MVNPIRPTDDAARALAKSLLASARHGALGVLDGLGGLGGPTPVVTRVATAWLDGAPHLLVSDLSMHTKALDANPACSLLIGEPDAKGDPLTHPRLTLVCSAQHADKTSLRDPWLETHPKAKLYFDFADFRLLRLVVNEAYLNGGFGKAFRLAPQDLQ